MQKAIHQGRQVTLEAWWESVVRLGFAPLLKPLHLVREAGTTMILPDVTRKEIPGRYRVQTQSGTMGNQHHETTVIRVTSGVLLLDTE